MSARGKKIVFCDQLRALLENPPPSESGEVQNRKTIAADIGVNPAELTHYLSEKPTEGRPSPTRPRFERLIKLAQALDVGLDELVFGDPKPTPLKVDYEAMAHYFDAAFTKRDLRDNNRSEVTDVLIEHLIAEVKELAKNITKPGNPIAKKLDEVMLVSKENIDIDDIVEVARIADEVFTLSLTLRFSVGDDVKGGQLLEPAAKNIKNQRPYRYLIPEDVPGLEEKARWLEQDLRKRVNDDVLFDRFCQFRVTKVPLFSGATLYRLKPEMIPQLPQAIAVKVTPHIDTDNWFGAFHGPWTKKDLNPVMDKLYLARARAFVNDVWDDKRFTRRLKQKKLAS